MHARANPSRTRCHQEEVTVAESEPIESQSIDSTPKPFPDLKPEALEEEDPQPLEFLQDFEDDLFRDFGNTSNHSYQKRPPVLVTPLDPSEEKYRHHTNKELTTLMSNEWL